jgi:protein Cut8
MSTSPQPAPRTLKRYRASPPSSSTPTTKRPLPLPRLLDNLEKPALVAILNQLVSRHPELTPEIQSLAPKLTPQTALQAISKLEDTLHSSFPYGGDKAGEYAYSRVHASLSALLQAIQEYTRHFLPPQSPVSAAEVLAFLDGTTGVLGRVPGFANPIHNLAREAVAGEIVSAWEVGVRWFIETNGAFAFGMGGWLEKIERHADKVEGLRRVAEVIREQISWINL